MIKDVGLAGCGISMQGHPVFFSRGQCFSKTMFFKNDGQKPFVACSRHPVLDELGEIFCN